MAWRCLPALVALAGCASASEDAGAAMQAALDSNRASLGVLGPTADPAASVPGAVTGTAGAAGMRPSAPLPAPSATPMAAAPPAGRRPAFGVAPETAAALIGVAPEAVLLMLGTPQLRRSEGTGDIWLYAGPDCHLDLVFYTEADGTRRVAHAQARADGAVPRTETECLAGIAQRGA